MREAGGGKGKVALCLWFFHLPPAPTSVGACPLPLVIGPRTTGFVGDWWRTAEITNDDDASSPNRLHQRPEKKERRAWEIFNAEKFFGSAELTSRALQKAT